MGITLIIMGNMDLLLANLQIKIYAYHLDV